MPKITGKSNIINRRRQTLGHEGVINASIISTIESIGENNSVFELIITEIAGETISAGQPVSIISNTGFVASNLFSQGKPCHGIALNGGSAGDIIKIQIGGLLLLDLSLTANKDVFLRASGLSQIPLVNVNSTEDSYQRIGRALASNILLINIEEIYKVI